MNPEHLLQLPSDSDGATDGNGQDGNKRQDHKREGYIRDVDTGPHIPEDAREIPKDQVAQTRPLERVRVEIASDYEHPVPRNESVDPIKLKETLSYYPHQQKDRPMTADRLAEPASKDIPQVLGVQARVLSMDGDRAVLEDGRMPALAVSCVVRPEPGDTVLVSHSPLLVLAVLERPSGGEAKLHVPGAVSVKIQQERVVVEATRELALRSLRDAELTAATGTLSLSARNLFTNVVESLVERAADRITKVGTYALDVASLLRMKSRHGIVRAEKQMCIDAEQIHLG